MSDVFNFIGGILVVVIGFALQAMWIAGMIAIGFWLLRMVGVL